MAQHLFYQPLFLIFFWAFAFLTKGVVLVLHNISTTQGAKKLCLHLKILTSDFLTNERLDIDQPSLRPACKLCDSSIDSIEHVMVSCPATSEVRSRLIPECCLEPMCQILKYHLLPSNLTQFILDCTSFNLPDSQFTTLAYPQSVKFPETGVLRLAVKDPACSNNWHNWKQRRLKQHIFKKWQLSWCTHKHVLLFRMI